MIKSLLLKVIERNLLLFEDHTRFAVVTVTRLLGLFGLILVVKTARNWDGSLPSTDANFWTGVALALFAIGLASAFYVSANRAVRQSSMELRKVLLVLQHQQRNLIAKLQEPSVRSAPAPLQPAEAAPSDESASPKEDFELMDRLLSDDAAKQILIALFEGHRSQSLQREAMVDFAFQTREGSWQSGSTDLEGIHRRLAWTDFLCREIETELTLTQQGRAFARWLVETGKKAPWFVSSLANWGDPPPQEAWPFFTRGSSVAHGEPVDTGHEAYHETLP